MNLSESDLELYRSMTSRRARQTADCLGDDLLLKAAANDLNAAERDAVVAHLGGCSDCAREYRIARSLRDVQSKRNAATFSTPWWAVAAAAVIALMLPVLLWLLAERQKNALMILQLEQRIETQRRPVPPPAQNPTPVADLIRPQIGVPIIDLDAGNTRESKAVVPAIVVPPTSDIFTLILHLNHIPRGALNIELADANGRVVWRDELVPDTPSGSITVALNRRAVPAGAYSMSVQSTDRKSTFRFRVE